MNHFKKFYESLIRAENSLQPFLLLVIRLFWGWQFFLSGFGKLLHIGPVAEFFASLHIVAPLVNAYAAAIVECVGGLFLLVGLFSRLITIPLIFTMGVAYFMAHRTSLITLFSNPDDFLMQAPFLFLFASVIIMVFGPGKFSLDALIFKGQSERGP
jgi:putative oxidoreductase